LVFNDDCEEELRNREREDIFKRRRGSGGNMEVRDIRRRSAIGELE